MFAKVERPTDAGARAGLEASRSEAIARQQVIQDRYLSGRLSVELYESGIDTIESQLSTIDADLAALPDEGANLALPVDPGVWLTQIASGELTQGGLPAAFLKACGSLDVARNVLAASLGRITVLPSEAGVKPVERLLYEAP